MVNERLTQKLYEEKKVKAFFESGYCFVSDN